MVKEIEKAPEYQNTMVRLESAKRISERGSEYWFAREIQGILGYSEWRNFQHVIGRTTESLQNNGEILANHIVDTNKMVEIGSGAKRSQADKFLSRAACYLIAMNGDPSKPEIAAAQSYFAAQTRAREIEHQLAEDEKRLELREKTKQSNKNVASVAQKAGVIGKAFALFQNARFRGLYHMNKSDYDTKKGLGEKENAFDRMGSMELSANDFQMNLAAKTIEDKGITGQENAIRTNEQVGEDVRATMKKQGVYPENLPLEEPIKEVRKRVKKSNKTKTLPLEEYDLPEASVSPADLDWQTEQWVEIVDSAPVSGIPLQLARNCVLAGVEGDQIHLQLDPEYETLAAPRWKERLREKLSDYAQRELQLEVEVPEKLDGKTPAMLDKENAH